MPCSSTPTKSAPIAVPNAFARAAPSTAKPMSAAATLSRSRLLPLAMFATVLHFVAVLVVAPLARLIPRAGERSTVAVTYEDGRGVLRQVLAEAAALGCETTLSSTKTATTDGTRMVRAEMRFRSGPALRDVMAQLADVPGVVGVELAGRNDEL